MNGFEQRLLDALTDLDAARPVSAPRAGSAPRRRRVRLLVAAGAAAATVLGAAAAVAAVNRSEADFAASETALIGGQMHVKGSGCEPSTAVALGLDEIGLGQTVADADGLFFAMLTVPADTAPGPHTVTARCGSLIQRAPLTVIASEPVPDPMLDMSGAAVGKPVYAKGVGCQDGAAVTITLHTVPVATATGTAERDGYFVVALAVPAAATPGRYPAEATCTGRDGRPLTVRTTVAVVSAE